MVELYISGAPAVPTPEINPRNETLHAYEHLFALWEKSAKRRETTVTDYRHVLLSFAEFVQRKPLATITRREVVNFRDHLLDSGQSARTASRKVGILKTLFLSAIN